jgi:hypothetical protein
MSFHAKSKTKLGLADAPSTAWVASRVEDALRVPTCSIPSTLPRVLTPVPLPDSPLPTVTGYGYGDETFACMRDVQSCEETDSVQEVLTEMRQCLADISLWRRDLDSMRTQFPRITSFDGFK